MAQLAVTRAVGMLGNLLIQEAFFLHGVRDQIDWVRTELQRTQCFLKDADAKGTKGDERVKNWVREIRDVAYQVEDIIDVYMVKIEKRRRRTGFMGCISRYAHIPDELIARHRICAEIEKIKTKIRDISESRATYGINNLGEGAGDNSQSDATNGLVQGRKYDLPDEEIDVIGFEHDQKALIKQLFDMREKRRCVLSIVGMGGIGKTTLVRKVCNHYQVKRHFDALALVSVSQLYRVTELLKGIIKKVMVIREESAEEREALGITREEIRNEGKFTGITKTELERMDEEEVREKLYEFLTDRRYLIVLDDVWTVEAWDQIKEVFPNVNNGSRLILSTRSLEVAKYADPANHPHVLHLLNDEESWKLFRKKAFPRGKDIETGYSPELESLGRQLVGRCSGLPLALVVLGGLLSRKDQTYAAWSEVSESMDWESTRDGQRCFEILAFSYNDLPDHHLRSCFLYIGCYPEDAAISASKLIRLWIAEGFIPQSQKQMMEGTARGYLDELVQRSMIQVAERGLTNGRIKNVYIHDLLREWCISEARKDGFMNVCGKATGCATPTTSAWPIRRVSLQNHTNLELALSLPSLHTLLCFNLSQADQSFTGLKLLRVIDLEGAKSLKRLPKEIGSMIHLRYLGLRGTTLKRLPSSIGNLCNLQTLDVRGSDIRWFPNAFWRIQTLRHLYVDGYTQGVACQTISFMKNLQTLTIVKGGKWLERDLAQATNLRKLGVGGIGTWNENALVTSLEKLEHLVSFSVTGVQVSERMFAVFPHLHHLRTLKFAASFQEQRLPASSEFPPNLTKITLTHSLLKQDPMVVLEKLPNLIHLEMNRAYLGRKMVCSAGGFPQLRCMWLVNLVSLEDWWVEDGAMPKLTDLVIDFCWKLKMLPSGLQRVTTLKELLLSDMPRALKGKVREDRCNVRRTVTIKGKIWELPSKYHSSTFSHLDASGYATC